MRAVTTMKNIGATFAGLMVATAASAQETLSDLPVIGHPTNKAMGFQKPATELMRDVIWMDGFLLTIITIIAVFVTALLLYCLYFFNEKRNPNPATFTHNSVLEVAWTVVPILILIAIIPPSLSLLFKQQEIPTADVTIKATGNQWYWTHEYVDHGFEFDSYMIGHPATLPDGTKNSDTFQLSDVVKTALTDAGYSEDEFLLATDTAVVIPTGKNIVVQVTGADVIHSWAMPAFGVKQDAVPGRLAQLWFNVDEGNEGIYFGQCSELCGKDHSYMPITVKAVSQAEYAKWLESAKEEYAGIPTSVNVANATVITDQAAN